MAHYYDSNPETPSDRHSVEYRKNGVNFLFTTDSDVFSKRGIDFGTDLLLTAMIDDIKSSGEKPPVDFLDLGCGYGVVGIVMKSVFKGMNVTQVDKNERAIGLSRENARENRVPIGNLVASDVLLNVPQDKFFDIVATNPPVRAGKSTVFAFYEQSYEHMRSGAVIYVVLQRKQGAPSTEKKLTEIFGNCETVSIEAGYRVMKSKKI